MQRRSAFEHEESEPWITRDPMRGKSKQARFSSRFAGQGLGTL